MQSIDITEKKLIAGIINLGYRRAAESFSSLTGQNVKLENTSFEICDDHNYLIDDYDPPESLTILQTDIIGQVDGASYLILNAEEKKTIANLGLETLGNPSSIRESAILKEIDNIISAAVITELSNALDLSIYGDVPKLLELANTEEFRNLLNKGTDGHYLVASTNFAFDGHRMVCPFFIWKFDKKIMSMTNA